MRRLAAEKINEGFGIVDVLRALDDGLRINLARDGIGRVNDIDRQALGLPFGTQIFVDPANSRFAVSYCVEGVVGAGCNTRALAI